MRVTTIAQEAIIRGHECRFVGKITDLPWVEEYVRSVGFISLDQNIDDVDPIFNDEVLIFDSYTMSLHSPYNVPEIWKLSVCITDHFAPEYSADIHVRQSMLNVSANGSRFMFSGPNFALVRKEVRKTAAYDPLQFPPKILILGGGSDPYGFVKAVLQKLSNSRLPFVTHVFSDENLDRFASLSIHQHPLGPELDALADSITLVITTASTASIEFIAREIPTLIACAVENQEKLYSELVDLDLAIPIGGRNSLGSWQLNLNTIETAIKDQSIRLNMRRNIQGFVDLMGPSRILDEIEMRIANGQSRRRLDG